MYFRIRNNKFVFKMYLAKNSMGDKIWSDLSHVYANYIKVGTCAYGFKYNYAHCTP